MAFNLLQTNWMLNLVQEEKTDHKPNSEEESPTCFHHQEIAFSDCSHPESASSSNENGVAEDCVVSVFNGPSGQTQEVRNYEHQDGLNSTETESEDNDIDEEEDDGVFGSGEEDSSKATGCTSLDYNEEPAWPAELIQEQKPEFKGGYYDGNVCSDCDADGSDYAENDKAMTITNGATLKEKANLCTVLNDQPSVSRNWVIPMLLLALLLILVLLTRQESFYVLDEDNSLIVP